MTCKCKTLTNFQLIQEFHKDFGRSPDPTVPTVTDDKSRLLRAQLMFEEFKELIHELGFELWCHDADGFSHPEEYLKIEKTEEQNFTPNLPKIAKETADLLYVTYGTASSLGLPIDKIYKVVHDSNMSKKTADGQVLRREDGKVLKSDQYQPPNVEKVINGE